MAAWRRRPRGKAAGAVNLQTPPDPAAASWLHSPLALADHPRVPTPRPRAAAGCQPGTPQPGFAAALAHTLPPSAGAPLPGSDDKEAGLGQGAQDERRAWVEPAEAGPGEGGRARPGGGA